jgi:hypothetical protein
MGSSETQVVELLQRHGYQLFRQSPRSPRQVLLVPFEDPCTKSLSPNVFATKSVTRAEAAGVQFRRG